MGIDLRYIFENNIGIVNYIFDIKPLNPSMLLNTCLNSSSSKYISGLDYDFSELDPDREIPELYTDEFYEWLENYLTRIYIPKQKDMKKYRVKDIFGAVAVIAVIIGDIDWLQNNVLNSKSVNDIINDLIECAIDNKKHEITAMLIDYKGKNNLYESQEEYMKRWEL